MATTASRMASTSATAARPAKRRSLWWVVHSWAGLKLTLFLTWIMLTGTLAVFSVEMDWLARPALRVTPMDMPHASWGAMAESAAAAVPGDKISAIYAPPHAWFAAEAMTDGSAQINPKRIYLNPYDARVQGTGQWISFQRFFREMHRHLLLPAKWGIPIVSSLSLVMLVSLVTGLVSYKKFWRGFLKRPRGGNPRRLTGDLHRLGGLWGLWFVALIGLTGLWYLIESLGGDAPYVPPPKIEEAAMRPLDAATIDGFAAIAQRTYPGLAIKQMRLPAEPGEPIGFFGQADALLVRDRANGVWIDPADGRVIEVVKGETLNAHYRISEMADPLHFGTWGGMATKVVWFLFGALLTALCVTGAMIYSMRLATAYGAEGGKSYGSIARLWLGTGRLGYAAAGLLLLSLAMLPGWLAR